MPGGLDINTLFLVLAALGFFALLVFGLGYIAFNLFKWRGREERSIESVLLQIAVPKGNEIKIGTESEKRKITPVSIIGKDKVTKPK